MSLLVENALKVSLLMLAALAAVAVARRRSAALRHWILAASMMCAAAMPLLGSIVPSWRPGGGEPTFPGSTATQVEITGGGPSSRSGAVVPSSEPPPGRGVSAARIQPWLVGVWLAGAAFGIGALLIGLLRLAWLAASATRVTDARLIRLAAEVARAHDLRRAVTLLHGGHPAMLVTWGLTRPRVMLPAEACGWSDERARIVLGHELAHVRRADWSVQIAAEVLRSIYWFNPLLWMACRQLRLESEHACDDAVLSLGVERTEYASQLVDVARAAGRRRTWLPAPAMARASSLERRVKAMLNTRLNRTPMSRTARLVIVAALLAIAVPLAGLGAQNTATIAGTVYDQSGALVPNAALRLYDVTQNLADPQRKPRVAIAADANGRYEFPELGPGSYMIEPRVPGFHMAQTPVLVDGGQTLVLDLRLNVGNIEETVTVVEGGPAAVSAPRNRAQIDRSRQTISPRWTIKPPVKIVDVRPDYPAGLRGTGTGGDVLLECVIDSDGFVKVLRTVQSPHPDLTKAAVDAVRRWEFDPTRLHDVVIDTTMNVRVNFKAEQ